MPRIIRRPRSRRPRAHRPRRGRGLRREGLPPRHDRRRRPPVGAVGRRHLHALHGQGAAVPVELRPRRRAGPGGARSAPRAADHDRGAAARRDRLLRRDRSTTFDGAPGQAPLVAAWAEADAEPGRPRHARPPPRAPGRGRDACSSRRASPAATCRPGSTSMASPAASSACSTGCSSSASRPATTFRPADLTRRANAVLDVLLAAASPTESRRRSIAPRWPTSRPSSARSTRQTSGSRCPTSTPRSRCGTSRTAGTTGS